MYRCVRLCKQSKIIRRHLLSVTTNDFFIFNRSRSDKTMAERAASNSVEAIARLREFGYAFNDAGELRKIDPASGEPGSLPYSFSISNDHKQNQEHYSQLASQIPEIVYELLEKCGLKRTYIPFDLPIERATFVFSQPKPLSESKVLLILIHGSGYVLAGQWARRLIINNSLDHGTQLPYIKRAQKLGYDVLVTNTNDTCRLVNEEPKPIKDVGNANAHALYVMQNIVMPSHPHSVAIVAHSYGAAVARFLAEQFSDFFKKKVFAIALTDGTIVTPPTSCKEYFVDVTCNWASCDEPLDTELNSQHIKAVSAGHPEHEWSSYSAFESVFKYIEEKYNKRMGSE